MKRLLLLGLVLLPSVSTAQDYVADVAGWKISDTGHKPNDDSGRYVVIEKQLAGVSLVYGPNGKGYGGTFKAVFPASKGCKRQEFNVGFVFEGAKTAPATEVRNAINAVFATAKERCPGKAVSAVDLLKGFDDAFVTVHRLVIEKPYVFPPAPTSGDQTTYPSRSQGQ